MLYVLYRLKKNLLNLIQKGQQTVKAALIDIHRLDE